jgi:hypothetical protein
MTDEETGFLDLNTEKSDNRLRVSCVHLSALEVVSTTMYLRVRCNSGATPSWEPILARLDKGRKWAFRA